MAQLSAIRIGVCYGVTTDYSVTTVKVRGKGDKSGLALWLYWRLFRAIHPL